MDIITLNPDPNSGSESKFNVFRSTTLTKTKKKRITRAVCTTCLRSWSPGLGRNQQTGAPTATSALPQSGSFKLTNRQDY